MINYVPPFAFQCTYSVNECPISHPSQLVNPFLGLPLEFGRCEACGTAEPGQCEGLLLFLAFSPPKGCFLLHAIGW